jgi:hypothetical protein
MSALEISFPVLLCCCCAALAGMVLSTANCRTQVLPLLHHHGMIDLKVTHFAVHRSMIIGLNLWDRSDRVATTGYGASGIPFGFDSGQICIARRIISKI